MWKVGTLVDTGVFKKEEEKDEVWIAWGPSRPIIVQTSGIFQEYMNYGIILIRTGYKKMSKGI